MKTRFLFAAVLALGLVVFAEGARADNPPPPDTWVEVDLEIEFDEGFSQIFSKGKNNTWVVWVRADYKNKTAGNKLRVWVQDPTMLTNWYKMETVEEPELYYYSLGANSSGEESFFFKVPVESDWGVAIGEGWTPTVVYAEIINNVEVVAWHQAEVWWWGN
jgi:hypothetical protein